ncbi:gluon [Carabus blaptoides fortunei]
MNNKRKYQSDESGDDSDDTERVYMSDEEGGLRVDDIYVPPPPRPPGTIDNNGPRLIITQIVNENFKSYGGEKKLGPFHKNFNAIVGPNGSGKSNVIDSMLFVFGYRASKIRSKKISVLLHKSEQHPNIQFCKVSIHFARINDKEDDPDAYEIIPDSEFVVSRTALKDSSSYYQLNGSRVQYKEIASLLRKHGVDLDHNRFLILQGEVEQISLMKPKAPSEHETGMLEYLEDIIGTTRYKEPLGKIEEKVEILSNMRAEKLNRVKLAEREKDDLVEPMKEAVQFLELENEVAKKKNFLYQRQLNQLQSEASEMDKQKTELIEKKEELEENLNTRMEEKKVHEDQFKEEHQLYEKKIKRLEQLKATFDAAHNKDMNLQAEMGEINKRRKKIIEQLADEETKLKNLEKVPEKNHTTIVEYEGREKQLAIDYEGLESERTELLSSLREETLILQEKKENIQTKLVALRTAVDETKSAFNVAESELKIYVSSEENERQKLQTLMTTFEDNKQKLTDRAKSLRELKQRMPAAEKQLKDAIASLERVKLDESRVIQEIKVQRAQVEETRSSMQANKSRGRVLDSLSRQKIEGNLPGLFGRLGDLGAIDMKYDVAVSTACGPLDNIVVDTVDTAQWCIEYLKAHNIGRATFIALDKQEHLRNLANSKINTPENVPRLYDLIRIEDERVRPAFYYALRDTLVANEINQASRIAYGARRFRVVTLKGELIETSGTMSGGGKTVSRGRMGQCVTVQKNAGTPRKMQDMETSLTKLEQKVGELRQRQTTLEDEVNSLDPQLRTMKTDLEKFTIEVQSLQAQQPALTEQIKRQTKISKETCANPAQIKKLQAIIDTRKADYEEASAKSEQLQKQVDVINKEIKDKTEKKMRGINTKINECSKMLDKCKEELVKLRVAIKTAERNAKKSREKIANLQQEKVDIQNKILQIQADRKEIEEDAHSLVDVIDKLKEELSGGKGDFSGEQETIAKMNKTIKKLKTKHVEMEQELGAINKKITDNSHHFEQLETKLKNLKLQKILAQAQEELRTYTVQELTETDTRHMEVELKREEDQLKAARPNLTAIQEFEQKEASYLQRVVEFDHVTTKRTQMRDLREDLRKRRQTEFQSGFNLISTKLKEMYQLITLGGDAELEMVDSYDPFAEGIQLNVRPPKKSWKNITNLSGGEKTLSSLALVFALHYYKPSPLYFMDEIDAALDFKNVSIVGNYIKARTKNAQFIIISLRSNMFELADHLVGIYKTYNITKSVTINPRQYAKKPAVEPLTQRMTQIDVNRNTADPINDDLSGALLELDVSVDQNENENGNQGNKGTKRKSLSDIEETTDEHGQKRLDVDDIDT